MRKTLSSTLLLCGLFLLAHIPFVVSGCGGSSASPFASQAITATTGRAQMTVRWPERTRLIPFAAESIKVQVVRGTELLGQGVLQRPENGGTASLRLDTLPVGQVVFRATAHPETGGAGVAQARAEVGVTILAGQIVPVKMTLASTIDRLELTPALTKIGVGESVQYVATAKNTAGEVVITDTGNYQWRSTNTAVATADAGGLIKGVSVGTTIIEATEKESGKKTSLSLTVGAGPTPTPSPTPPPPGTPRIIDLVTNDLVYDKNTQKLYASIPSSVGANGNSIRSIDPVTGTVGPAVFIGSEPGMLRVTSDGQFLYVALNGARAIRRFNLVTQTAGDQFSLNNLAIIDMEVIAGYPERLIVIRHDTRFSVPGGVDTAIFVDGVPQEQTIGGISTIVTNEDGTRLYGYDGHLSSFGFLKMPLANGTWNGGEWGSGMINRYNVNIWYGGGFVYADTGEVIDPEKLQTVGQIGGGQICPDPANKRVFVLNSGGFGGGEPKVTAYHSETFVPLDSRTISGVGGGASLLRWGTRGIAFRTGDKVVILNNAPGL